MRIDNRKSNELRPYSFQLGFSPLPLGSVLVKSGNTTVLCNVGIDDFVPSHCVSKNIGWITAEYAMVPHAGHHRSVRDGRPKIKGRVIEIQRMIGRSLRAGVNLSKLGNRTLTFDCDVLIADGGTRTASITGCWVALRLALAKIFDNAIPEGLLVKPLIAAVSAGVVQGQPLLDLNYEEDSSADLDMNLVAANDGTWIEIQAASESQPQSWEVFNEVASLSSKGIGEIIALQRKVLSSAGIAL